MAVNLTLMTFAIVFTATISLPLLVQQHVIFTYLGLFNTALSGALYFYLATAENKPWHPYLVLLALLLIVLPVSALSGGVGSQYVPMLPIICMLTCFIANTKTAWVTTAFLSLILLLWFLNAELLPNYAPELVGNSVTRLFWLVMACVMATAFGMQFEHVYTSLGVRLQEEAKTDGITGLLNRSSMLEILEDNLQLARREKCWLSVMLIDLDQYKWLHEVHGQLAADQSLKKVAACLKHHIRNRDDLLGSYSEERFIVVMNDVDQSTAMKIAEKIRAAIQDAPISLNGDNVELSVTLGYCSLQGEHIASKEQLLKGAEQALQAAQKSGRNLVVGAEQSLVTSVALV